MQCNKVNMDNYRFYLPTRIWSFESSKQDLTGEVLYFSGAPFAPRDGDPGGCTCFSCHSNLEHCSGLGLKMNHSSFPLICVGGP